jgi:hypothetical protein
VICLTRLMCSVRPPYDDTQLLSCQLTVIGQLNVAVCPMSFFHVFPSWPAYQRATYRVTHTTRCTDTIESHDDEHEVARNM